MSTIKHSIANKDKRLEKQELNIEILLKSLVTKDELISLTRWMIGIWITLLSLLISLIVGSYIKLDEKIESKVEKIESKIEKIESKIELLQKEVSQISVEQKVQAEQISNIQKTLVRIEEKLNKK